MRRAARRYWRGDAALAPAFLLGFAAPALLLGAVDPRALTALASGAAPFAAVTVYLGARVAFYLWQTVGLLRAGDRYLAAGGERGWVAGSHAALLLGAVALLLAALGGYQQAFGQRRLAQPDAVAPPPPAYRLSARGDGAALALRGALTLGVSADAAALLDTLPDARMLVLESRGGSVFAARGLAELVRRRRLDTAVVSYCESACMIVFISGRQRTLSDRGRLGFHQYRLRRRAPLPRIDVDREQNADRRRFAENGVDRRFLDRLFERPPADMWYPAADELIAAGVVHRIRPHAELQRHLRWPF